MLDTPGEVHLQICGSDLTQLTNESGIHALQRVPPTEKSGRVHTSTVTVAIVEPTSLTTKVVSSIPAHQMSTSWFSGTGNGGQRRNKVQACCRLTHVPSNITKTAQCRTRELSYMQAYQSIIEELNYRQRDDLINRVSNDRLNQISFTSGNCKIRTYRFKDSIAVDHRHNKKTNLVKILDGWFNLLW